MTVRARALHVEQGAGARQPILLGKNHKIMAVGAMPLVQSLLCLCYIASRGQRRLRSRSMSLPSVPKASFLVGNQISALLQLY